MPDHLFKQKAAIVTGAGQGIGFEIARQLALEGASVVLNDADESLAQQATKKIQDEKGICIPIAGDVSVVAFNQQMVDHAVKNFGKLDIAIANAGITLYGDFFKYPEADFYKVLEVNLGGSFFLAQAAAQQMKKQGHGGSILLMSSVTGHQAHKDLAAYGMTKAGIEMLARTLVVDLSPYKIRVNTVAPGATLTERTTSDPNYVSNWSKFTPMGKAATPADIAHAALFLVSHLAGHITGQSLVIDGGWSSVSTAPY